VSGSTRDRQSVALTPMTRRGVLRLGIGSLAALLACLALSASPSAAQAQRQFAPVDQKGPKLRVDREKLRGSLACTSGVRNARRTPVLLVPATGVNSHHNFSWNYARLLNRKGIPWCTTDQFGPRNANMTDIQHRGQYLTFAIRRMHRIAGRKISILGHSQGGMAPRVALRFWPGTRRMVADVIGMAPSNHGTDSAAAACGRGSCTPAEWQQWRGSRFMRALNSRRQTFARISYTQIFTIHDVVVTPPREGSSLRGPGRITNVAVQEVCPADPADHLSIGTTNATAAALVLDALGHRGPANPTRVDPAVCVQRWHAGINPQTLAADAGAAAAFLVSNQGRPATDREPQLRCWVFAKKRACRRARRG
jgi:hypothetical protein